MSFQFVSKSYHYKFYTFNKFHLCIDFSSFLIAKPEVKDVHEEDEACYHYIYVLTRNAS